MNPHDRKDKVKICKIKTVRLGYGDMVFLFQRKGDVTNFY